MENLHKVGGSLQRLKQVRSYLWKGLIDDAIAEFNGLNKKRCDPAGVSPAWERAPRQGEVYGFDGGQKVKGRKRQHRDWICFLARSIPRGHILVDTLGLLLEVIVTEANGAERINGLALLVESEENLERLELIWVDQGYQGARFETGVEHLSSAKVEVMRREGKGFQLLARRWVVERTFAWLMPKRRLVVDMRNYLKQVSRSFTLRWFT